MSILTYSLTVLKKTFWLKYNLALLQVLSCVVQSYSDNSTQLQEKDPRLTDEQLQSFWKDSQWWQNLYQKTISQGGKYFKSLILLLQCHCAHYCSALTVLQFLFTTGISISQKQTVKHPRAPCWSGSTKKSWIHMYCHRQLHFYLFIFAHLTTIKALIQKWFR